jgi:hypothetical protein
VKKILMIAFHYPPIQGSSGVHRTLSYSRYLPDHGWQPVVLTVTPKTYSATDPGQYSRIPPNVLVERVFALDSARDLSFRGAFPGWLAVPDRWISWWPGAVARGLRLIRRHRPQMIWSTFPIATAHLIGLSLHRVSGVPWVADFRDPMTEEHPDTGQEFPSDPAVRRAYRWIERSAVRHCSRAVFTTPGTAEMYAERFSDVPRSRWAVIPNGYEEESFAKAQCKLDGVRAGNGRIELLHSGVLYPDFRDPKYFFEALAELRSRGEIDHSTLRVVLRGSGHESLYRSYVKELGIADIVSLEDQIPYEQALAEMLGTDGLLIFQASACNWQIPAKLYEYLRARRPILAFTDPDGDTARLLRSEGIQTIVPIDSKEQIARALGSFLRMIREGGAHVPNASRVERHSRRLRTAELAALLDSVTELRRPCPSLEGRA